MRIRCLTRWHDVCLNMPCAIQEVLYAWEHGAIKQETVQKCATFFLLWSNLMLTIIRHMVQELIPQSTGLTHRSVPYTLPSHTPILKVLSDKLHDIFNHGCIDIQSIHQMAYLLNIGGTLWFCENTVKAQKLRRLSSVCDDLLPPNFGSDAFNVPSLMSAKDDNEPEPSYDTNDALNKALVNLFRLFNTILNQKTLSPRTEFVSSFVGETLKCETTVVRFILQFMPTSMIPQLLKCLDHSFTSDLVLHMCDLSTASGRNVAAKAICQHAHSVYVRN
ncbi:hypothetical protein LSH36_151g01018 [Paralvinella palmiformis]|uniref:Mediator of RNA polymerase II transcription subunit 24 n=1 Tax=Paralvinella palmiformis TaxID=53620 RepID=A0AAD9N7C5_9ANNE|nr:hypothetical protein LSH36_151g01018 [Paralvinella palmiformis]